MKRDEITISPDVVITARLGIAEWYKLIVIITTSVVVPVVTGAVFLSRFDSRVGQIEKSVARAELVNERQNEILMRLTEAVSRIEERTRR